MKRQESTFNDIEWLVLSILSEARTGITWYEIKIKFQVLSSISEIARALSEAKKRGLYIIPELSTKRNPYFEYSKGLDEGQEND